MEREILLEQLLAGYKSYFNISENTVLAGLPIAAEAEYHARDEKYVLVKSAQLWAAENNEYAFFITPEVLTAENLRAYYDVVLQNGMSRVKPEKDHMCSYVTLVVLAGSIEPEAAKLLKKLKYTKNFLFSIRGWAEFRVASIDCATGVRSSNACGKEVLKTFRQLLG